MNEADSYEAMLMEYEAEMDVDYGGDYDMVAMISRTTILCVVNLINNTIIWW